MVDIYTYTTSCMLDIHNITHNAEKNWLKTIMVELYSMHVVKTSYNLT